MRTRGPDGAKTMELGRSRQCSAVYEEEAFHLLCFEHRPRYSGCGSVQDGEVQGRSTGMCPRGPGRPGPGRGRGRGPALESGGKGGGRAGEAPHIQRGRWGGGGRAGGPWSTTEPWR